MKTIPIPTAAGTFTAHFSNSGLCRLDFPTSREPAPGTQRVKASPWEEKTAQALRQALQGKTPADLPPLDLSSGTPFQQEVWRALAAIPSGQTRSYLEVAQTIGRPKAARAVGQACGANPVPVLIPCHRVLASQGGLGGFSGGLDWKRQLLDVENRPMIARSSGRRHEARSAATEYCHGR